MAAPGKPTPDPSLEMLRAHQVVLLAVATLAELRESDTESHILRVQAYVELLCRQLQGHPAWTSVLSEDYVQRLRASVPMYDLGTVGVPDRILLKPGRLAPEEITIMRTHTTLGHEALARAEKTLGQGAALLDMAKEVALSHHEKWNGSGYPQGRAGADIPPSARIIALADVYDALITSKVYRQGLSHEQAVQLIFTERESHFDPDVVDAFMEIHPQFAETAQGHADSEADMQQKIDYLANAIAETTSL